MFRARRAPYDPLDYTRYHCPNAHTLTPFDPYRKASRAQPNAVPCLLCPAKSFVARFIAAALKPQIGLSCLRRASQIVGRQHPNVLALHRFHTEAIPLNAFVLF